MKEKLKNEKIKEQLKIQNCNDISSLKAFKNEDCDNKTNQSVILKDYYKTNDGNYIQEVKKFIHFI